MTEKAWNLRLLVSLHFYLLPFAFTLCFGQPFFSLRYKDTNLGMITCSNCGRVNDESSRICRYCGTVLGNRREASAVRDYAPPSAHGASQVSGPQDIEVYSPPGVVAGGYRCPTCGSNYPPVVSKQISVAGWIVFASLLIVCLPLFWNGHLMKEEQSVCPMCRVRIS